jgi:hypothetical protein
MRRLERARPLVLSIAFGLGIVVTWGCEPVTVRLTKYPRFEVTTVRKVAVLAFADAPNAPKSGESISDMLAAMLAGNEQWEIYNRQQLAQILKDKNAPLADTSDPLRVGRAAMMDAIIVGHVNQYGVKKRTETIDEPVPNIVMGLEGIQDASGYHYITSDYTRLDAGVSVSINLVSVATGKVLWWDTQAGSSYDIGAPPKASPDRVLQDAVRPAVDALYGNLVPHPIDAKVPDGSIYTSKDFVAGKATDRSATFAADDPRMYVVLALPQDFHKTALQVQVSKKGNPAVLKQFEHTWDATKDTAFGFELSPKQLVGQAGPGTYEACYFISGAEIRKIQFTIRK